MHEQTDMWFAFDTVNTVSILWTDAEPLAELRGMSRVFERLFSRFREDSDIGRINRARGETVTVDPRTAALLREAIRWCEASDGSFDVTVGAVEDAWDFKAQKPALPDPEELAALSAGVDYRGLTVEGCRVRIPDGTQLDLGGIAKGYIADEMGRALRAGGVKSGLINLGGNVLALGGRADGGPWRAGVRDPGASAGGYCAVVLLRDLSAVTSGIYERGFDSGMGRMHHILDTRTGRPVQNELAGVTVLAPRSVDADALSTACLCLGTDGGRALLDRAGRCAGLFITRDGEQIWHGPPGLYEPLTES